MAQTKIQWTDKVWNALAGCNDKSEGCRFCYARRMAHRLELMGQEKYKGLTVLQGSHIVWTGKITFYEKALMEPLKWRKPCRIFVNSMSDLFHHNVTDDQIDHIFAVMAMCPQHVFQVLTKRPERMPKLLASSRFKGEVLQQAFELQRGRGGEKDARKWLEPNWPLPNVWLGVSVENQEAADERIPLLVQTPAAVRFISAEPLLGPVSLERWSDTGIECSSCGWFGTESDGQRVDLAADDPWFACPRCAEVCAHTPLDEHLGGKRGIHWVICGGESGPGARPMHPDWVRSLRDQCAEAGVEFFFKQWGEWLGTMQYGAPADQQLINILDAPLRLGKKAAGDLLDGRQWHQFPNSLGENNAT